ncbi:MAG: ABC transporter ATP-binding protein [Rhodospirillales bacterium]
MIEIQNVSHRFERRDGAGLLVLDDVSLSIGDGKFVSFLGPSGCGKTTLLRICNGLVRPASGQILIDGKPVNGPARDRAMVFQEFNLMPWRTAQRNIELALEFQGKERGRRPAAARDALRLVGLGGFERYFPHQLSGGMKQRVGIARALCTNPDYLFMDEPFGALDPQIREIMQVELLKLLEAEKRSVVFVTHSVDEAIFLSDQIVMFSARPGRILATLDIELPKPRWSTDEEIKASAKFVAYRKEVWHLLKREVQQAMDEESEARAAS